MIRTITLALVAVAPLVQGADWTQFRGSGGVSAEKELPVKWGADEGLRWKAELPGRGVSNPVIAGGKIFLTASSGYENRRLHVLAFDEKTGKKLWERQFAATGGTSCHPKTCMAANTPVTDGKRVFAMFGTCDIVALDADGNLLWYRSLVSDYPTITNQVGMAASPVLYKDTLLVPMENVGESFAAGLDANTGKNRWKMPRHKDINWVTPLVVETGKSAMALFQTEKDLTAYDVETGRVLWSFGLGETLSSVSMPQRGDDGFVFVAGKEFLGLRTSPQNVTPDVAWRSKKLALGYTSAVYHDGRVYGIGRTAVTCLDAKTGEEKWSQRIDGPFSASPIIADGKLYAVNELGKTTVLKLGDTKAEIVAVNSLAEGEVILATPAVANGAIYLRSDKYLYCVGTKK
jgi:outer membrane protein assembly factor BamB